MMETNKLDENKICFIAAVNDMAAFDTCLEYLQRLNVPAGMEIDYRVIQDAHFMTEACQTGMESSDAKYKIYLHQDALITEPDFLHIMVREFQAHPEYGIAGVVGSKNLPLNVLWWEGRMLGSIRDSHDGVMRTYMHECDAEHSMEAAVLDGVILMTQYDIPWRTDIFDKWHFYDLSQCMEFRRHGYKAAVLPQSEPLVTHVSGIPSMRGYEDERIKFVQEYGEDLLHMVIFEKMFADDAKG